MAAGRKTGGRAKGVPNKATKELKEMILAALEGAGGIEYLQRQADASPAAFISLLGKIVPMQVNANASGDIKVTVRREIVKPVDPNG